MILIGKNFTISDGIVLRKNIDRASIDLFGCDLEGCSIIFETIADRDDAYTDMQEALSSLSGYCDISAYGAEFVVEG